MAEMLPSEHAFKLSILIKEAAPMMLDKLRREFTKLFGVVEQVVKITQNWKTSTKELAQALGMGAAGLLLAIGAAVKEILFMNEEIAILGQRFGMSRDAAAQFNAQLYTTAAAGGVVADQLAKVASELLEAGFKGRTSELAKLSETIYKFSGFTGVSIGTTAAFAGELSKLGINTNAVLNDLAGFRSSMRLSTKEFESVIEHTKMAMTAASVYRSELHKGQEEITRYGAAIGKLSAEMQALGFSTEFTTKIVKGLTDPLEWLNDPKLMVALGINLSDIEQNLNGVSDSFKNTNEMIVNMANRVHALTGGLSGLAKAGMMRAMGIPPDQVAVMERVLKMTETERQEFIKLGTAQANLNDLWKNMGDTITPLKRAVTELFSTFILVMKPVVEVLTWIIKPIVYLAGQLNILLQAISGLADSTNEWNKGMAKVGTLIIGGGILLGIGWLVKEVWKFSAGLFRAATAIAQTTGELVTINPLLAEKAMAFQNLANSISQVGVQSTLTNTSLATLGKTPVTAGLSLKTSLPTEKLIQAEGSKAGQVFGKWFGRAFAAVGILTILGAAFVTKKFTVQDLSWMALSLGMMFGATPLGWGLMAAGILGLILGSVFPKFGNFDILSVFGAGGKPAAKPRSAISRPETSLETLKRHQEEIAMMTQSARDERDSRVDELLEQIKNNTGSTVDSIGGLGKTTENVARRKDSLAWKKESAVKADAYFSQ